MEFCLKDQENKERCLSEFRGKWVVLYFYPHDDTPGCTKEAIEFSSIINEFEKLNAVVIGVNADSCESHKKFYLKHGLKVILLSDPNKEVINKFGVWGKKKLYGKEFEGIIRSTFLINPEGEVVKEWRNVKAEGHAEEVLKTLKEIQKSQH